MNVDKRKTVICQGGLLGVRIGVHSVNTCSVDVENSKRLPKCLQYLRWATSSQPSYRWASKLQSPTQLTGAMPESPVHLSTAQWGSILAFRLSLIRFLLISSSNIFNHPDNGAQSKFGNIQVRLQNQWAMTSFTLSTQVQQRTTVYNLLIEVDNCLRQLSIIYFALSLAFDSQTSYFRVKGREVLREGRVIAG